MSVAGAGSGAAPAEGGEAAQGQQAEGAEQQQQNGLPEALDARFNEFEGRYGAQMAELLQALQGDGGEGDEGLQQQAQPQYVLLPDGQIYDLSSGQLADADAAGEAQGLSPEQIQAHVQAEASRIAQEAVAPLQAEQRAQQLAALEDTYSQLRDPATAQAVVEEARRMAERVGAPEAWRDPEVLEQTYLAMQARERAGQEDPATGRADGELEQPGASGATAQSPADEAKEIVAAGGSGNFFGV